MDTLKNQLRKRLAEKFLGKQAIGAMVERVFKKNYPDAVFSVYVKFTTVFVKTSDRALQIAIFRDKKNILVAVNEMLEKFGYVQKMKEVICLAGKYGEEKMTMVFDRR